MAITQEQVKAIRQELSSLKPETAVVSGNGELTVKQTIMALAPTLERMKKRGFELAEIVFRLHEKALKSNPRRLPNTLRKPDGKRKAERLKGRPPAYIAPRRRRLVAMRGPRLQTHPPTSQSAHQPQNQAINRTRLIGEMMRTGLGRWIILTEASLKSNPIHP